MSRPCYFVPTPAPFPTPTATVAPPRASSNIMRPFRLLLPLLLLATPAVWAQSAEIGLTVGMTDLRNSQLGSLPNFGSDPDRFTLNDGIRVGARISLNSWFLANELSYAWQRSSLDSSNSTSGTGFGNISIQNVYYNLLVHATPSGTKVRPFVTGGVGVSVFNPPGVSSLSGAGANEFGFNYGGGLKFKVTNKYGFRIDIRDYSVGKPFQSSFDGSGRLRMTEYSATFSLLF